MFNLIAMIRRYILVVVMILFPNNINAQIMSQVSCSLFMMGYTRYYMPFQQDVDNNMNVFCEIVTVLCSYHLFGFTLWVYSPQRRYEIGWSFLSFIILTVIVNFTVLGVTMIKNIKQDYRKAYNKFH